MCSFIMQHKVCSKCRSPIEYDRVDHQNCGRPPKRCPGTKKRGTKIRYAGVEECNKCTLESLDQVAENGTHGGDLDSDKEEEPEFPPERPMQLGLWM